MNDYIFVAYDQVPSRLRAEVESGKREAFHEDSVLNTPEKRQEHEDRFCSHIDRFKYLLAMDGTHVVGALTLLKRHIIFSGKLILIGGIAGVWTRREYENQGIATHLLQRGMVILKQERCDIAYLCTDVDNPARIHLYGKVGFVPLHKAHTYLGKSGKKYVDDDAMIAPLCSPQIFQQILESKDPLDLGIGNW